MPFALLASVGVNVILGAGLYHALRQPATEEPLASKRSRRTPAATNQVKTHIVIRKQFFSWSEIESDDYPTYIANLRAISCPESTIRDIIVADVNQLYAKKQETLAPTYSQEWWRTMPNMNSVETTADKIHALDEERRALLTRLLGPGWDTSVSRAIVFTPSLANLDLSGPVLGALAPEAKEAMQSINARSQRRQQDYIDAQKQAGKPVDPAELARLRQQTRDELAQVLTPPQMEEYLLRYSNSANTLRQNLGGFEVSADEFRKLFRLYDSIDQQMTLYEDKSDPDSVKKKNELAQQKDAAIAQALGPERYQLYQMEQDPVYRDARDTAEQLGAPPETVIPLYLANQLAMAEQKRINDDTTLSPAEKYKALQSIRAEKDESILQILSGKAISATPPPVTPPYGTRPAPRPAPPVPPAFPNNLPPGNDGGPPVPVGPPGP